MSSCEYLYVLRRLRGGRKTYYNNPNGVVTKAYTKLAHLNSAIRVHGKSCILSISRVRIDADCYEDCTAEVLKDC